MKYQIVLFMERPKQDYIMCLGKGNPDSMSKYRFVTVHTFSDKILIDRDTPRDYAIRWVEKHYPDYNRKIMLLRVEAGPGEGHTKRINPENSRGPKKVEIIEYKDGEYEDSDICEGFY